MSDHYHYEYADARHDHRGEYADDSHDHDLDYAGKHHAHFDLEREDESLRADLRHALGRISDLEGELDKAYSAVTELAGKLDRDVRRLWAHISNMPGGV